MHNVICAICNAPIKGGLKNAYKVYAPTPSYACRACWREEGDAQPLQGGALSRRDTDQRPLRQRVPHPQGGGAMTIKRVFLDEEGGPSSGSNR
jgi:hypothetical protein